MSTFTTSNPATGEALQSYNILSNSTVEEKIRQAESTYQSWRLRSFEERAKLLNRVAELLEERTELLAQMATQEMGKTLVGARAEVVKCAWVCRYYAEHAASFLGREYIETDASSSFITYQPLGVILAVMPWNYPYWQVFRFAAPALMAGNVGLLKHAPNVLGCGEAIAAIFRDAGFPEGALTHLVVETDQVKDILAHKEVMAATLTGSGRAGSAVAAESGRHIKKTVLELGGSDAYLILEDADLEEAATISAKSRLLNVGQSCIGAKRFIVLEKVYDEWLALFKAKMAAARIGDPLDENTDLGPMAREDLRQSLHQQVERSVAQGAKCILGGDLPDGPGVYYPPTILTNVEPGMPAYHEELFGPVATVFKVADEAAAIRLANDSPFGLGAAVFTRDTARGERIAAEQLEAGCCFVNGLVKSDPRLPFGGIKISGYGRELSYLGIREFTNTKTVWVR